MAAPVALEPPSNRGMTFENFDKNAFRLDIDVVAARVPTIQVGKFKKDLASSILAIPRITSVSTESEATQSKLLLLDKAKKDELPSEILDIIAQSDVQLVPHRVTLGYDYWNATQILRAILPEELLEDLPASFTVVGHIAHFNLRDEYLPYKQLIGQVVLDKNPAIETVVNKLDSIDNEYRFFEMEVLAGKPDFKVTTSENGCQFRFDFSKVYWNSRLQTEHTRLVDSFDEKDVVADGFAGVGPFAIPAAAKKGCLGVLANDLNPMSAEGLRENVQLNKVHDIVRCYNMDGREFFRQAVQELYNNPFTARSGPRLSANKAAKLARHEREERKKSNIAVGSKTSIGNTTDHSEEAKNGLPGRFADHFVLNLPATAITFLDAFQGIYTPLLVSSSGQRKTFLNHLSEYTTWRSPHIEQEKVQRYRLPMVHCYCFTKEVDAPGPDINQRATLSLGYPVSAETLRDYSLSLVRSVAPAKDMYRLSFRLPEDVVFAGVPEDQRAL